MPTKQQPAVAANERFVTVGKIGTAYGIDGWMKIHSFTDPIVNLIDYQPWLLTIAGEQRSVTLLEAKVHGKGLVIKIAECQSREQVADFTNADITVPYDVLPALDQDEYYWSDLEGLNVITTEGVELGVVDHLFETGANDVVVVKQGDKERLIPFLFDQTIIKIDMKQQQMLVDWDPEF